MKAKLHFSKDARANLISIGLYTERNWGLKQRDIYLKKIFYAIEKINNSPLRGQRRDEIYKGIRSFIVEEHVIYYFYKGNKIFISGILHQRMDPSLHKLQSD